MESSETTRQPSRWAALWAVAAGRNFPLVVAGLGILLTLPSLTAGLIADDYHHKLLMEGSTSVMRVLDSPLDMFRLINGDARRVRELTDVGFLPWWTDPSVKAAFWRPLSSLTHWLDYILWPQTPALMHAQSIAWYAVLVAAVALLYRRMMGPSLLAGLAALLYCIDDAHVVPVGFLANRNALLAALFGVLCLLAHDDWRRKGRRSSAVTSALFLALSLLSKEEGIATCAYLAAYELFMDSGPRRQRCVALIPYALIVLAWRLVWSGLGYGVANMGLYVDPLDSPLVFAGNLVRWVPILLLGQLALPPADLALFLEGPWLIALSITAGAVVTGMAMLAMPALRHRVACFWATGMILSAVPMCTTFPTDRMLMFVGIGGMGLVATFLGYAASLLKASSPPRWRRQVIGLAACLLVLHGIVAPIALALRSSAPWGPRSFLDRMYISDGLPGVEDQDLIIVNPPAAFALMISPITWAAHHDPLPSHLRVLTSSAFDSVEVTRIDERTLRVHPKTGFFAWKVDRLWRNPRHALRPGDQVTLTNMDATVGSLRSDGRPTDVLFHFAMPLEDRSFRWLQWDKGRFIPFVPPPIGKSQVLVTRWGDAFDQP